MDDRRVEPGVCGRGGSQAKRSDAGESTTLTRLACYRPGSFISSLNLQSTESIYTCRPAASDCGGCISIPRCSTGGQSTLDGRHTPPRCSSHSRLRLLAHMHPLAASEDRRDPSFPSSRRPGRMTLYSNRSFLEGCALLQPRINAHVGP